VQRSFSHLYTLSFETLIGAFTGEVSAIEAKAGGTTNSISIDA
jgi:hypothetical protein